MAEQKTRLGTPMHPQVFTEEGLALIRMRVHLAEQRGWLGLRPAYINYALSERGWVVQFEDDRDGYTYACHFPLAKLRAADFRAECPLLLADFAQQLGVSANVLLVEALVHAIRFP
jgi:hypothetical protein